MKKKPLVIISGATAVGKTELSLSLARQIHGRIISADSMQVYKGFDIGTAKIKPEEMQGIPHYLIDELEPWEEFNVYEFQKRCKAYMQETWDAGEIPIIVGGTGFYIQSILYDIDFTEEEADPAYRKELEELAEREGAAVLHEMLSQVDPEAALQIHENNRKRVIRALEYYRETGRKISDHNEQQHQKESPYNYAYFVLNRERAVVYERINRRVDQMMQEGLVQEVRQLLEQGISPDSLAMQGLGYKEIAGAILGEYSLDEAAALLKLRTRHFAKRQLTWFRREKDVIWMDYESYSDQTSMLEHMIENLKEKAIVSLS